MLCPAELEIVSYRMAFGSPRASRGSRLLWLACLAGIAAVRAQEALVASAESTVVSDKVENVEGESNERIIKGKWYTSACN